jgi:prophage maintenance system killer protein
LFRKPFEAANEETALHAALALLRLNGYDVNLPPADAAEWLGRIANRAVSGDNAIREIVGERHEEPATPTAEPEDRKAVQLRLAA